jgi:two-component system nitrate/nitrite response regulator NarL
MQKSNQLWGGAMAPTSMSPAIRVTVVASSPVLGAGLASWLDGYEDMRVVAVGETVDQWRDVGTDVAVVGLAHLGIDAATRAVARVRGRSDTKLVAVVDGVDDVLGWVVDARVDACLNIETVDAHQLVDTVRAVVGGRTIISTELLSALRGRADAMALGTMLTPRERDVLALLTEGQSNKSIAHQLELEASTIRVYVSMILTKLGVTNRTEAAAITLRQGLLTSGHAGQAPTRRPETPEEVEVPAGRERPRTVAKT